MPVKPIPEGYRTLTPYLVVRGADKTIEFLKKGFGAELSFEPMVTPDGKIMHADLKIGDSHVMISEATDQHQAMQTMVHVSMYRMSMPSISARWPPAAPRRWSRRTSSTATAPAA